MSTLVVLNYNDWQTVKTYIERVKEYSAFEHIVIVDNFSSDDSYEKLIELQSEKIDVIQTEKNGGYGYGNNFGIKYAIDNYDAKYILVSNPDVEYEDDVVQKMETTLKSNPEIGVVAPVMLSPEGEISELAAWKIPTVLQEVFETPVHYKVASIFVGSYKFSDIKTNKQKFRVVDCVPGSLLMVNAEHMRTCGFYDENMFLYCEETVLGIRMKNAGFKTLLLNDTYFYHVHSVSITKSINSERMRMAIMWESRRYVLKEYYKISNWAMRLVKLYEKYNIFRISMKVRRK